MYDYDKELEKIAKRASALRKQKANAIKRENEQIGRIAKEVFVDVFPNELCDVKAFFEVLSKNADKNECNAFRS